MTWTKRWKKRLRTLVRREAVEGELDEELAFHLEMETQKNLRAGMSAAEARRQAALAFGGMEKFKEEVRDARRLGWIPPLSLDFRLGIRMLVKHPGLALVGGLGMTVAIAVGAGVFSFIRAVTDPSLPLHEGERIVAIHNLDAASGQAARHTHLHDLEVWRESVSALVDFSAYRTLDRNLIGSEGGTEPLRIAEITASGFRVARVPPLLGRYLVEEDERSGAPPVVVIGEEVWRNRFVADPAIVGRTLQIGADRHTIVGVMPDGFRFPVNNQVWTPLRLDPATYRPGEAPSVEVFGRLASGATLEQARAQLAAVGQRAAEARPETHEHLRPQVLPYARAQLDNPQALWIFYLIQLLASLLLVVVAANVATLVYARTATRAGEIAVRLALGASRARVVAQLFVEALVLSVLAAALGLAVARRGIREMNAFIQRLGGDDVPYWWGVDLAPATVLYATGLALLAAAIVGVLPALKVTGKRMQASLREIGGGTGMRMGRTWTALIVVQVAVAVAILPLVGALAWKEFLPSGASRTRLPAQQLLSARVGMDREIPPSAEAATYGGEFAARLGDRQAELVRRLVAEPGVAGVTFASSLPGAEYWGDVEVEAESDGGDVARRVNVLEMHSGLFAVFDVPVLVGRPFRSEDRDGPSAVAVVNRSFVEQVLGGGDALGRRLRYTRTRTGGEPGGVELGDWYEIVGVVSDFGGAPSVTGGGVPTVYHPAAIGDLNPVTLVARVQGVPPERLTGRLQEITRSVDPTLRLSDVSSLAQIESQERRTRRLLLLAVGSVALSVLLFSTAGIHALMSFTVAQRRKEVGIRAALGAHPRRILAAIFRRSLRQLSLGVLLGGLLASGFLMGFGLPPGRSAVILLAIAALITGVGMLAAAGPARRALRIQPMEALREE